VSKIFEALRKAELKLETGEAIAPAPVQPSRPQVFRSQPAWTAPHSPDKNESEWLIGLRVVRKHWRLSALFAAVVIVTVVIITFSTKSVYEPIARIEVDPPGETFSLEGGSSGSDAEYLETQAQNLKSDRLAIDVIRQLHLDQDVEGMGKTSESATGSNYQLTPQENSALRAFRSALNVKRDTASRLIAVSFASHDPQLAARATNTVVSSFIEETYKERHDSIMRSSEWLSRQLDDIRSRMVESNRVLADFQRTIGVADIDENRSTFGEQMVDLNRQLTQAQADSIQLEALLKSVQAGTPDAIPEVRSNTVVQQLTSKLAELRGELSQNRVVYGANHPNVKKIQSQIDELQAQLDAQKASILVSMRTSYSAARARENLMNSEIKGASSQMIQMARYNELKKEAQANADVYNSLYAKVKEAGIAAASKSSNLHVVDEARVLDTPTRPNRLLSLGFGFMIALAGGVGLAFLCEHFDTRIFTPEDMRGWIGTSNIAIVPLFLTPDGKQLPAPQDREKFALGTSSGGSNLAPDVSFLLESPHSPEAEALRSLYTSVMLSSPESTPQVILVVSSFPGEGKTTVAVNLAMAMAQHGSTCLVDADLRRGRVASALGISSNPGLTDVLTGDVPLEHALARVPSMPELTVIPAHAGSPQAGQLACSDKMRAVLDELREKFQFVVVDSAPILPFADGRALSNLADGLIFVGRSGKTTREVVQRSLELLNEVHGAPVLEFVLNAADISSPQYKYYQYGHDYYQPVTE